jgi:N,N-dimethylformamidase
MPLTQSPHQLNADLFITDWMEQKSFEFDLITDEDLHREGLSLLGNYRVLVTGSHPEYWTKQMLDALDAYEQHGGRLMYLGGNGFYWVTSFSPNQPHVIEVRRGQAGSANWASHPGEDYHSTTGVAGGTWRQFGRSAQQVAGVSISALGGGRASPYRRTAASRNSRAAWIFEGVGEDEPIGERGLVLDGAAGYEVDRADDELGTPPHALVVATARGLSTEYYKGLREDMTELHEAPNPDAETSNIRADMVFYETPNGGAVFSTGSIAWSGSLSWNSYNNAVSQITANVLHRFAAEEPL